MPSLFDVGQTYDAITRLLHESLDEHGEANADNLAIIDEWFAEADKLSHDKADGYANTITRLNADAKLCREEAARLSKRAKTIENAVERLKQRLKEFIDLHHNGSFKTTTHNFAVAMSTPKVEIEDESLLWERAVNKFGEPYVEKVETVTWKLNREAILMAWKAGEILPGVQVTRGTHLKIT